MLRVAFDQVKNALSQALTYLPDFNNLNAFEQGKIIDKTFKSVLKDLMQQFGMKPGVDYVDNLKENEPGTDFVALSKQADELITGLMEGNIIAVKGSVRTSKLGKEHEVKAYFRRKSVA